MLELCLHELEMRSQVSPSRQLGWVQLEGRGGGDRGEGRGKERKVLLPSALTQGNLIRDVFSP